MFKRDKQLHFLAGFLIAFLGGIYVESAFMGLIIATAIGAAKEGVDYLINKYYEKQVRHVELADFFYTLLGGIIGSTLFAII